MGPIIVLLFIVFIVYRSTKRSIYKTLDKTKRIIAFENVERVIESCETYQQLLSADNMIESFTNMYGSDNDYTRALNSLYLEKNQELASNLSDCTPDTEYQLEQLKEEEIGFYGSFYNNGLQ